MKLAVVLVNYNGKKYNEACIESVRESRTDAQVRIFVVDNASQDGSVQILRERYGEEESVEIKELSDNYGFSHANNVGICLAGEWGADAVLLLNNDTEISETMLQELLARGDRHPGSMIVPKIYYSDHRLRIWSAGGRVSPVVGKVAHIGLNEEDRGQYDEERQTFFATGCCLFIPMQVIKKAGVLDERFFLYYEDTEYSFRLQKQGIAIWYCPQAVMYHKVGASTRGADSALCAYYIARNWLLCSRLQLGRRYPVFLLYYVINRTVCCLLWLLRGKGALIRATWLGIRDFHRGRFGRSAYYG